MNELELEGFEGEEASVGRKKTVGGHPQDVRVDDAYIENTPEEVLPPTPASTPYTIVRPHLI